MRAYRDYTALFDEWWYWAPGKDSRVEVDFLLRKGKRMVAIEVKSALKVTPRDYAGLMAMSDLPNVCRRLLIYGGARRQVTADGIELLPVPAFLELLARGSLFE